MAWDDEFNDMSPFATGEELLTAAKLIRETWGVVSERRMELAERVAKTAAYLDRFMAADKAVGDASVAVAIAIGDAKRAIADLGKCHKRLIEMNGSQTHG
jgi:hypothetical protein